MIAGTQLQAKAFQSSARPHFNRKHDASCAGRDGESIRATVGRSRGIKHHQRNIGVCASQSSKLVLQLLTQLAFVPQLLSRLGKSLSVLLKSPTSLLLSR